MSLPEPADERFVARAAGDGGVAGGGIDDVVAGAADERLVPAPPVMVVLPVVA